MPMYRTSLRNAKVGRFGGELVVSVLEPSDGGRAVNRSGATAGFDESWDWYSANSTGVVGTLCDQVEVVLAYKGGIFGSLTNQVRAGTPSPDVAERTGSAGYFIYRSSKAAANMVMRNMALDLKASEIAVMSINPGMVLTDFGPGAEMMGKMGCMPVEDSVSGTIVTSTLASCCSACATRCVRPVGLR